jgi:hypothetical protein
MPEQLQDIIVKTDAEEFLRISSLFTEENGYRGMTVEFADGFDFQRALDGLVDIQTGLESDIYISSMPTNLLWEWAKRDWDGAIQWAVTGKKVEYNDLQSLARSVVGVSTVEQYAALAAFVSGATSENTGNKDRDLWRMLSLKASPEFFSSYLEQAPGGRPENLSRAFRASYNNGGSYAREVLISQMAPAERVAAFQSADVNQWISDYDRKTDTALLRSLGHSDEEIARMIPPAPKD